MEKYLHIAKEKIEALKFRERLLLTAALLAVIYVTWQPLVVEKIAHNKNELEAEQRSAELNITALQQEYDNLIQTIDASKVTTITERINKLRNFNKSLEAEIIKYTEKLIPPNKILNVLHEILRDSNSVKIVKLTNLPESPLFKNLSAESSHGETVTGTLDIFKHGISIELNGKFFDIMEFLYKLEQLKWNLLWDGLEYEVKEYPIANVKLALYTLSLSSDWLGFD